MAWSLTDRTKTTGLARSTSRVPAMMLKSIPATQLTNRHKVGRPLFKTWSTEVAVQEGLKVSSWVYACVEKRMSAVASVPLVVQARGRDGRWLNAPEHPLQSVIARPNPWMPFNKLTKNIVADLDLGGNAVLSIIRVRGNVDELWLLPPDQVKPIPGRSEYIDGYQTFVNGVKGPVLRPEDVIHFSYVDPADPFWGISPLVAGSKVVDMDVEAVNWNKSAMQNRAVPDGMISFKEEMSDEQFTAANDYLESQLMGQANTHRPFVAGFGAKYESFAMTMAEMDFIESRKMNREEICGLFGVPPPMVGIYDKATLANIREAREIFWEDTIVPLLMDLQSIWNFVFQKDVGEDVRVVYDTTVVESLRRRFNEKVETGKRLFDMGVPLNEVNRRLELGLNEIEGGDVGYVPINLQPATQSGMNTSIPGLGDDDEDDE